jgi:Holliday junction resolvasome RuvABC ATP-dependent DNA helicase subunit
MFLGEGFDGPGSPGSHSNPIHLTAAGSKSKKKSTCRQEETRFNPFTLEQAREIVKPTSPYNKFRNFIGNSQAVRILSRAVFSALQTDNHSCGEFSFSIIGPPSTGKTTLVKLFAEFLQLPLVIIQPQMVSTITDVLVEIASALEEKLELQPIKRDYFKLPAMVIFIDEVHALKNGIVQGLLKAIEAKDRLLETENGFTACCKNVCWIVATTDRGELFDAFDTRFTKVHLNFYTVEEMAKIVEKNSNWSEPACLAIAKIGGRIPREVIALARDIDLEFQMNGGSFNNVLETVREEHGIDKYGMTYQRLRILKALNQGPIAKDRLATVANCKPEELHKFVMPPLIAGTEEDPPLVSVGSKGYIITESGKAELKKRGAL